MGRLLPHKSWNVYGEKQREKVRLDVEAAALAASEKATRAEEASGQATIEALKRKKKKREERSPSPAAGPQAPKHINFFEDVKISVNPKAEEERKKIALVGPERYLTTAARDAAPWYAQSEQQQQQPPPPEASKKRKALPNWESREDPLFLIDRVRAAEDAKLQEQREQRDRESGKYRPSKATYVPPILKAGGDALPKEETRMERLRRERLEREGQERKRAEVIQRKAI
jgi:hypothetical protein